MLTEDYLVDLVNKIEKALADRTEGIVLSGFETLGNPQQFLAWARAHTTPVEGWIGQSHVNCLKRVVSQLEEVLE